MPQRDLVRFNPCSSSLRLLISLGATEKFKGAEGHNLKWLCSMACTIVSGLAIVNQLSIYPEFQSVSV